MFWSKLTVKIYCILFIIAFASCDSGNQRTYPDKTDEQQSTEEQVSTEKPAEQAPTEKPEEQASTEKPKKQVPVKKEEPDPPKPAPSKVYSNERFRNVKADRISDTQFRITGKARVFEATFNWVIEDGHEELQKGYQMTDAGAPEWGNFNFTVNAVKKRRNSTLHLLLFESSAKDGSRLSELPVLLY